ncbi:MAG TPA: glycosyltransferase family 2 protein [Candidatus Dormibacteraeota bacterium]|nr:glycosyltransferase family 2 protein [Candidatus Dormibacteraeota bacterium]
MSMPPPVSICLPSFNNEAFIGSTIKTVLTQSFTDFELVVVDDKSSDRTVEVVRSVQDPRIRLMENERNLGLEGNWTRALSCSRGKYVKLLCGDDLLYPGCLAQQVAALERHSKTGAVLALCNREVINSEGRVVFRRKQKFAQGVVAGRELIRKSVRWGSNLIGEPAVGLFVRDAFAPSAFTANPYLADLALWAEVLKHGNAFVTHRCLAAFRISQGQASARIGHRQAASFRTFVRQIRRERFYRVNALDSILGSMLALPWCVLRNGFMRFAC